LLAADRVIVKSCCSLLGIFVKRPQLLISLAWLLHAVAWFLPVVKDMATFPRWLPGWGAFRYAASAVWPVDDSKFGTWYYAVLATVSSVTTLLFIFGSPWAVLRGSLSLWRATAWAAATALVVNAHWYVLSGSDRSDLRIGYVLWWFSFPLLAIGLFDLAERHQAEFKESQAATNE
jgi:hypothetical protein